MRRHDIAAMKNSKAAPSHPRVFIMDTWIYPYRTPIFGALSQRVRLEVFFSLPRPFDHLDDVSPHNLGFRTAVGRRCLLFIPFYILSRRYDVYIVGQIGAQSLLGALFVLMVAKIKRRPLVLWTDYVETDYYRRHKKVKRAVGDMVAWFYTRCCSAMFALGEHTRAYLAAISGGADNILSYKQVVPEVCNPPPPPRARPADCRGKTILLCVSYLRRGKGLELLIDAFKKIARSSAILVVAGDGAERSRLLRRSADCPQIKWLGHVEGADKAFWYGQADVFVCPSPHETWGLVVNEAMHYGLPVIASDAAGASELIGDNGVVFKAGDLRSLRSALETLLHDSSLRRRMGKKSRAYIAHYGLDYGLRSFIEVIEYALKRKTR